MKYQMKPNKAPKFTPQQAAPRDGDKTRRPLARRYRNLKWPLGAN
ncbi:MAG: hypothetical protein ACI9SP_004771 [Arenicella sp.]|jgi:hypothetical protein